MRIRGLQPLPLSSTFPLTAISGVDDVRYSSRVSAHAVYRMPEIQVLIWSENRTALSFGRDAHAETPRRA